MEARASPVLPRGATTSTDASAPANPAATRTETPRKRRRIPRIKRPESGSLYDILHENKGTSLYTPPICWTDLHAKLLGISFEDRTARSPRRQCPQTPPCSLRQRCSEAEIARHFKVLLDAQASRIFWRIRAMKNILSTLYPNTLSKSDSSVDLDLHFGDRAFRRVVRLLALWEPGDRSRASFDTMSTRPFSSFDGTPQSSRNITSNSHDLSAQRKPVVDEPAPFPADNAPLVAYVNRSHLSAIRSNLFRIIPGPSEATQDNEPVSNLQKLRSKMLLPKDVDRDAHLAAIMLCMAQSRFYPRQSPPASRTSSQQSNTSQAAAQSTLDFRDVKTQIITHDDDKNEMIVYEATVTKTFLQRFASPLKAPAAETGSQDNGLRITLKKVPIYPITGLRERLGIALGQATVGEDLSIRPTPVVHESVSQDNLRTPDLTLKRKRGTVEREALAEVVNDSSFSSSSSQESQNEPVTPKNKAGIGLGLSTPITPGTKRRCLRSGLEVF